MKKQKRLILFRRFIFWGVVLMTIIGFQAMAMPGNTNAQTKEGIFDPVAKNKQSTIPSMDADAPGHYETASFGLG